MSSRRLVLALMAASLPLAAQEASDLDRKLSDKVAATLKESGAPSASVAVVNDGKLAFVKAFGAATAETRYAVLIAAIPCGFFGLVFGKGFNSSPLTASSSLIFSYVFGIATLAGWIVLLGRLG